MSLPPRTVSCAAVALIDRIERYTFLPDPQTANGGPHYAVEPAVALAGRTIDVGVAEALDVPKDPLLHAFDVWPLQAPEGEEFEVAATMWDGRLCAWDSFKMESRSTGRHWDSRPGLTPGPSPAKSLPGGYAD